MMVASDCVRTADVFFRRAGLPPTSDEMAELVRVVLASPAVETFGFYSHFGRRYPPLH